MLEATVDEFTGTVAVSEIPTGGDLATRRAAASAAMPGDQAPFGHDFMRASRNTVTSRNSTRTDRTDLMDALQRLNPASAPAPSGKYSQLTITAANTRVATFAGQIATPTSAGIIPAGAANQTRLVFAAIENLLASQGAKPADLIKLTTFIVGRDNLDEFNAVRNEIYAEWFPEGDFPGNTLILVAGLAAESLLVEIEGSFVCPQPGR
ncbi:RidA family protein [Micromonospora sp. DT4]|uniref:RidA family protein n=1 Tax=Micromonospora sp. DT4 TaxID=3393438 RepID=UPI003CF44B2C